MKSKITTKVGDKGFTSLWKGKTRKTDDRIICVGLIDELISYLGICRLYCDYLGLDIIQTNLSKICGIVIGQEDKIDFKSYIGIIEESTVFWESQIKEFPQGWFFFDKKESLVHLNYARTLVRKCELSLWKLEIDNDIRVYLNRLSDYLYVYIIANIE